MPSSSSAWRVVAAVAVAVAVAVVVARTSAGARREGLRDGLVLWRGCPDNKVPGWNHPRGRSEEGRCCGPANLQCVAALPVPRPARRPAAAAPRYYVGSAYAKAVADMMSRPGEWKTVRSVAGLFVHPMGFRPLGDRAADLMRLFKHKSFVIEESISAAYEARPRHLLDNYIAVMENGPEWTCRGIFLYVESPRFYDFEALAARYRQFIRPARDMGIPVYLFFMTLDVWNPANLGMLNKTYDGGKPMWVHFAKIVGASGVALDYPSWHWLEPAESVWQPEVYRQLAVRVFNTTKAAGLQFAWCLNGYCKSLDEVDATARQLLARGVRPDTWLVDHFHDDTHPGTPETRPTVTGQALALIRGKH